MKNSINTRIVSLYVFICFIAIVVVSKILIIQKIDQEITSVNLPKLFKIKASRGNIFSDDGSLLAISMPLYNVFMDLSVVEDEIFSSQINNLSISLAQLFGDRSASDYEKYLRSSRLKEKNKYVKLQSKVTHNELNAMKGFAILKLGKYKGGLIIEERLNRENPFGSVSYTHLTLPTIE